MNPHLWTQLPVGVSVTELPRVPRAKRPDGEAVHRDDESVSGPAGCLQHRLEALHLRGRLQRGGVAVPWGEGEGEGEEVGKTYNITLSTRKQRNVCT